MSVIILTMGRKPSTLSDKEKRAKWNETRYSRHKIYHQVYYLKNQYPQIFIDNKEEIKQWLIDNNCEINEQFIEFIRTFQNKQVIQTKPKRIPTMLTELFDPTELSDLLISV
jgi:hypothetical protein